MLSKLPLIAILAILPAAAPAQQAVATASFCERLAPRLGMKPNLKHGGKVRDGGWDVNLMKSLFGGSFHASFSLQPIDQNSAPERDRLKDACDSTKEGLICKISGPARLVIGTKTGKAEIEAAPGERADIELRRSTLSCHDG